MAGRRAAQLRLDKQTPYRLGESIKIRVDFPDNQSLLGREDPAKRGSAPKVQVVMEYSPDGKNTYAKPEILTLSRVESRTSFEAKVLQPPVGKYHFWLYKPDVSEFQPDHGKPFADAKVEPPLGEMDKLSLNCSELAEAAQKTKGGFYTLANADQILDDLPVGSFVSLNSAHDPITLWSNPLTFLLLLGLLATEWLLRKRKHLL